MHKKRTVVVAEDESVNRMDLVAMLEDNGYEVVGEAANGEEAVDLTRKFRPDIVCMDVKMPCMDGIAAAGVICDENIAPVVMLTAFSQPDLICQATGAGAMAYVTKPYEESKLLPALEVAMAVSPRSTTCSTTSRPARTSSRRPKSSSRRPRRNSRRPKTRWRSASSSTAPRPAHGQGGLLRAGSLPLIQKTSMDQRIPKKRLAMAIIAKYGDPKPSEVGE